MNKFDENKFQTAFILLYTVDIKNCMKSRHIIVTILICNYTENNIFKHGFYYFELVHVFLPLNDDKNCRTKGCFINLIISSPGL